MSWSITPAFLHLTCCRSGHCITLLLKYRTFALIIAAQIYKLTNGDTCLTGVEPCPACCACTGELHFCKRESADRLHTMNWGSNPNSCGTRAKGDQSKSKLRKWNIFLKLHGWGHEALNRSEWQGVAYQHFYRHVQVFPGSYCCRRFARCCLGPCVCQGLHCWRQGLPGLQVRQRRHPKEVRHLCPEHHRVRYLEPQQNRGNLR